MKRLISPLFLLLIGSSSIMAQVGVNKANPGSTLDINGSLAAQYNAITAPTYSMIDTDYYVSYNGASNSTLTLPTAISGIGNFKGRMYTVKNNTTFTVTINPAGSETINGNTSVTLSANQSVQLINTGLTGAAATWEVLGYNGTSTTGASCVPDYIFATIPGSTQTGVGGNTTINFNTIKSSNGITVSNGTFTLQAGKTYELEGHLFGVNFSNPTGGYISGQWVDASNNSPLAGSTVAEFYAVSYTTTSNSEMQVSKAVITPNTNLTVALRILSSNGTAEMRGNQSYAMIKQLNACGGGGGNTTIINNNVTASNGLNASGNDVKLGGTLSEATNIANAGNNLTVTGTGFVGIGAAAPRVRLEVTGIIGISTGTFPTTTNLGAFGWNVIQPGVGFNEYVNYRGTGNGGHRFYSLTSGTPTLANSLSFLDINGNWSAASFTPTSDIRLKRNIKPVENGLETILKLNPVSYEKKNSLESKEYNTKEIGFIAQEIRKILPDVVKETDDADKLLSVNYDSLVPVLTKAIQELNTKVNELTSKVQKLESENSELKKQK
ncbi:tail fiber domain-containing protein [Chryseobacterium sp. JUb7]|uniref:tail fiber domain-containing protein n=1 Tax=Chryseobacterium sp. JUb7 TaxID=2940599 RepID=UPI002167B68C|nr:tail fiber domain-containing protein [Chryseobacterium sp. JUb7]MCS3531834.1 hypothetical protein [Chryseobacterium sp. JUb7]